MYIIFFSNNIVIEIHNNLLISNFLIKIYFVFVCSKYIVIVSLYFFNYDFI
jgi:hypothetical protein